MASYLLDCACGRQHTVETRQAGESFRCECGAMVAVPTLRQLRQLPEARAVSANASAPGATWGSRQRTITVSLLVAIVCLAIAGMSRSMERPVPEFSPTEYTKSVDRMMGAMTPLEAWQSWYGLYEPLRTTGFEVFKPPQQAAMQQALTWHLWVQRISLALAALCGVVAVSAWFSKGGQ
ncbi:MAG: hypothetical protein AB7G28_13655 [Pirellulales bacterium]